MIRATSPLPVPDLAAQQHRRVARRRPCRIANWIFATASDCPTIESRCFSTSTSRRSDSFSSDSRVRASSSSLVEPRVLDRDRRLIGERLEEAEVLLREECRACAVIDVDRAGDALLDDRAARRGSRGCAGDDRLGAGEATCRSARRRRAPARGSRSPGGPRSRRACALILSSRPSCGPPRPPARAVMRLARTIIPRSAPRRSRTRSMVRLSTSGEVERRS